MHVNIRATKAKVGNLDVGVLIEQYVLWLKICHTNTMPETEFMSEIKAHATNLAQRRHTRMIEWNWYLGVRFAVNDNVPRHRPSARIIAWPLILLVDVWAVIIVIIKISPRNHRSISWCLCQ